MKRLLLALIASFLALTSALAHTEMRKTSIADHSAFSQSSADITTRFSTATGLANVTLANVALRRTLSPEDIRIFLALSAVAAATSFAGPPPP